jgi:hypothetical protein
MLMLQLPPKLQQKTTVTVQQTYPAINSHAAQQQSIFCADDTPNQKNIYSHQFKLFSMVGSRVYMKQKFRLVGLWVPGDNSLQLNFYQKV